jgi:hypothetical protein
VPQLGGLVDVLSLPEALCMLAAEGVLVLAHFAFDPNRTRLIVGSIACKLRVEYPGAIYHVMKRAPRRDSIFHDDADRELFLTTLAGSSMSQQRCCRRFRVSQ